MMLPPQAVIVPLYVMWAKLNLVGTLWPLILPNLLGTRSRSSCCASSSSRSPSPYLDAARVDGCGELRILVSVVCRLAKPAIAAVALFMFLFTFSDFFGPLLYAGDDSNTYEGSKEEGQSDTPEAWLHWLGPEKVFEVYAGTEAQAVTLINGVEWLAHRGSVGRPVVGEIEVRDEMGKAAAPGEIGMVWLRKPSGAPPTYEYLGARSVADEAGWESLGDMGSLDEEGFLYLTGRESDMILVGGSNVYPAEIEAVLLEHPAVLDACVIGLPDEDLGAVPHALVYLGGEVGIDELEEFVATRIAAYRRPRSYEVVDGPLRDDAGKLGRAAFRGCAPLRRATGPAAGVPHEAVRDHLQELRECLGECQAGGPQHVRITEPLDAQRPGSRRRSGRGPP